MTIITLPTTLRSFKPNIQSPEKKEKKEDEGRDEERKGERQRQEETAEVSERRIRK